MRYALLIAVAGCNQVYGLDATTPRDGAPPDAPPGCPATGTLPVFRTTPRAVDIEMPASAYMLDVSARQALGYVAPAGFQAAQLVRGPADTEDLEVMKVEPPSAIIRFDAPRLAPEGDEMLVRSYSMQGAPQVERYRLDGSTATLASTLVFDVALPDGNFHVSAPTARGSAPRRMMLSRKMGATLFELVETGVDTWSTTQMYLFAELGVTSIVLPHVSADGLRLVTRASASSGENLVLYFDRPDVSSRFQLRGEIYKLIGNGFMDSPYLTEDCTRLYFYAYPGVHYVAQN
jgi:hypothetical protein